MNFHGGLHGRTFAPLEEVDLGGAGDLRDGIAILVDDLHPRPLAGETIGQIEDDLTDVRAGPEIVVGELTGSDPPDDRVDLLVGQPEGGPLELRHSKGRDLGLTTCDKSALGSTSMAKSSKPDAPAR